MVFTDPDRIESGLFGEDAEIHDMAKHLAVGERLTVGALGDIAERIDSELQRHERHILSR
jgi:hypothetical protein